MQGKGIIKFFTIVLTIVCIYQLSFTLKSYQIKKEAEQYADNKVAPLENELAHLKETRPLIYLDTVNLLKKRFKQKFLDSIANEEVYNLGFAQYTYNEVKENEISLGLDLQGGMSAILQVSLKDLLSNLAGPNKDNPQLRKALDEAAKMERNSEANFVELFITAWEKVNGNARMAPIFATRQNQGVIEPDFSNERVAEILREQARDAIDRTYDILYARIDQFGVVSPYIAKLENSDRIIVELPGVDNPARARRLLQAPADLSFWETYKTKEIVNYLIDADRVVRDIMGLEDTGTAEEPLAIENEDNSRIEEVSGDSNLISLESDSATAESDSFDFNDLESETATDTTGEFDFEAAKKQNPLLILLNFSESLYETPFIGYVRTQDTAEVNHYLRMEEVKTALPPDLLLLWDAKPAENGFWRLYAIKKNPLDDEPPLGGDVIVDARQDFDEVGRPDITMVMNSRGTQIWADLTASNIGREVAIVLDGKVYSAPTVQGEIRGGISQISGNFTVTEAKDLANILKAGKLPAPAHILQESIVGPTLGKESIRAGVISMVSGLLLVLLFMVFYYSKGGLIADGALVVNIFFIFGILASLGATLTLPGIAGIVLTIGMAVDANVIIFERIREEMRKGKGDRLAVIDGYKNSYSAIIDGNVTTFITAAILFYFGLGPVLGFATTLMIGILSSLFTGVLLTRIAYDWMLKKNWKITLGTKWTMNAFSNTKIKFLEKRKLAYILSGTLILIGLVSIFTRGFELGVDFKGGRSYHIRFDQPVQAEAVRESLIQAFEGSVPVVKSVGSSNELKITTAYMIDSTGTQVDSIVEARLMQGLTPFFRNTKDLNYDTFISNFVMESMTVKPTIADDIKNTSILATIIALIGIFLYILIRFRKWQFSTGAIAALAHDVLVVLGIFALFHGILPFSMEVNESFIAAILTVIGYSINDTVIVFDRIREFLGLHPKASFRENINNALNSTLSRTLITSGTTFLVLLVLFIFGGEAIRGFSFAILLGVIVGTYSSLFIASPVMYDLSGGSVEKLKK